MRVIPHATVAVLIKETEGDINQNQPLSEMEGKDFFTRDIQEALLRGEADFAVHSLKDVSGETFFKNNAFAIIERGDPRDVAIFHESVVERIGADQPLTLGTSSPRRAEMATAFLERALPVVHGRKARLTALPIRGNVDTRLQKLDRHEYDGVILACAGLNRLLAYAPAMEDVSQLLKNKRLMVLPLMECPPAPGQGAIVAETTPNNVQAVETLRLLNDEDLTRAVQAERTLAHQYGSGCHQKFGVIHVSLPQDAFTYAAGRDRHSKLFTQVVPANSSLDHNVTISATGIGRLADEAGIELVTSTDYLSGRLPVWTSDTKLWFRLAGRGVWVEGSAEGFGIDFIDDTVMSPLISNHTGRSWNSTIA